MSRVFLEIFNLSVAACWIIAAVLVVRAIFARHMPKWLNCCLWGLVAIRLVIPFTFESEISLVPDQKLDMAMFETEVQPDTSIPDDIISDESPADNAVLDNTVSSSVSNPSDSKGEETVSEAEPPESIITDTENTVGESHMGGADKAPVTDSAASVNDGNVTSENLINVLSIIWISGVCIMLAYTLVSYVLLKKRVALTVPCEGGIRKGENVHSPFVFGIFRPRIYIPFGLSAETENCVVAHERAHLKRGDHIVKPLAFFILSVYWFNPFVWVAYILLCRDIEYACDEKVINDLPPEARKAYALALLECTVHGKRISACPVAFGESGVKERVKNTMNYKKPSFWLIIIGVIILAVVAVLFLTSNSSDENGSDASNISETSQDTSEENSDVYSRAEAFLRDGRYEDAYKLLFTVRNEEKAKSMLADFVVVCESEKMYNRGTDSSLIMGSESVYDENGNLIKHTELGSNGKPNKVQESTYDEEGNLLSYKTYVGDALTLTWSGENTYDADGKLIKEIKTQHQSNGIKYDELYEYVYDSYGNLVERRITSYFGFETVDVVKYILKYDEKGRLIEQDSEEAFYPTYFTYDDNDNLIKEVCGESFWEYDSDGKILKSKNGDETDEYTYNADGNLLKHINNKDGAERVYEYTYDENGFLVKKTVESTESGGATWEYYNDAYGNPEKTVLTYESGSDPGYTTHYSGYRYFYRGKIRDLIDELFSAEMIDYDDIGKYENCHRYTSDDDNVSPVLFVPETAIYDVRIFTLSDEEWVINGKEVIENILFEVKSVTSSKPLLADIKFNGAFAINGIFFTDEDGNKHFYAVSDSAIDGSLVISKFENASPEVSRE